MTWIVADTETGGFKPGVNPLLSIGVVELTPELDCGRRLNVFILPEPGTVVTEGAAKVNGYTPELWAQRGAVPLRQALHQVKEWIVPDSRAIAYNAIFDQGFVEYSERITGIRLGLHPKWYCAMQMFKALARKLKLEVPNFKLDTLAQVSGHWKVGHDRGDHQAIDDAIAAAVGYKWIMDQLKKYNESPF